MRLKKVWSILLIGVQNLKICTYVMEKIFSSIHSLNGALRYQKKGNVYLGMYYYYI